SEDEVTGGREYGYCVLAGFSFQSEDFFAGNRIPGLQLTAPAGGADFFVSHVHQDVVFTGYVICFSTFEGGAGVFSLEVHEPGMRVVGVVVPVVAANEGANGNVSLNVGVDDRVVVPDGNAGFHVDAGGPVQVTVRVRFDQQFTGRCIVDVEEAVTAGLEQRTDRFSFDFEVSDEVLAGLVKVPLVLGSVGVGPHHFPGRGVTRNRGSAVLVRVVVKCGREGRITA